MQSRTPSKLELYIEILRALKQHKASKLVDIQERTNVDDEFLERAIAFLQKQNLVEKKNLKDITVYENTPRGERVTNYFVAQSQGAPKQEFEFVIPADATTASTTLPVKN